VPQRKTSRMQGATRRAAESSIHHVRPRMLHRSRSHANCLTGFTRGSANGRSPTCRSRQGLSPPPGVGGQRAPRESQSARLLQNGAVPSALAAGSRGRHDRHLLKTDPSAFRHTSARSRKGNPGAPPSGDLQLTPTTFRRSTDNKSACRICGRSDAARTSQMAAFLRGCEAFSAVLTLISASPLIPPISVPTAQQPRF